LKTARLSRAVFLFACADGVCIRLSRRFVADSTLSVIPPTAFQHWGDLDMARGDLVSILCYWGCVPFRHYGIDVGDGTVVHLATLPDSKTMQVQRVSREAFAQGKPVRVETVADSAEPDEVVRRAIAAVGEEGYHLALGNCEHFARACKSGEFVSHQSDRVLRGVIRTGLAGALACSGRAATVAVVAGMPRAILSKATGVSSLVGELARHAAYAASRRASIDHAIADRIGMTTGTLAAAITGTAVGGPAGGATSAALYLSLDSLTQRLARNLNASANAFAGPKPCRKENGSACGTGEY
jgi:hypothetical protein